MREGHEALTEFGEEEGEDEPDGPSSDDEHRQMRRVASASPAGEGGEVRVLAAAEPPDRAPVRGEEVPAPAAGDRRHRCGRLGLRRRRGMKFLWGNRLLGYLQEGFRRWTRLQSRGGSSGTRDKLQEMFFDLIANDT